MSRLESLERINKALLANFDEVTDHDEPYISLSLVDAFPMPKVYEPIGDCFVDELLGQLREDKTIDDLVIGISQSYGSGVERVDEIYLEDLDDEELASLAEIAEKHQGKHYGKYHKYLQ